MKKITFLILTLLASSSHSQSFDEYSTLDGVYYGTSFWVEKENSITHDAVVVGYNENYDQFASTYDAQYSGYASTQQTISPLGMATGDTLDANEDGRMDFITAGIDTTSNAVINLYTQNTDGSFNETTLPMNGISNGKIKTGDLNHDGHEDFVVMGMSSGSNYIAKLYLGDGQGTFIESPVPFFPNIFGELVFFDANNNGYTDVLITGFSQASAPKSTLYFNDGAGGFAEHVNSGIGDAYFTGLSAGDYNNDGNIDILMSGMNASFMAYTAILQNDGTGHFTEISTSTFEQLYFGSANFIDYDNDGDLDVFITGTTMNSIVHSKLYTNNNGVFTENTAISSIIDNINISSSNWADFDADGDLDLIMNGYDENANVITKIYQNNHTQLCIPNFTNNTQENPITNVRFRESNQDSPDSIGTPTYENFISISTPIHRGEPHTITVTGYSNNYPSDVTVYIDLNQNTDLTDSNEEFYLGRIPAGNNLDSISATIYIPSNANLGLLKMRVIKSTNENAIVETNASYIINSPCAQNLLSGQVEDYTLNIKEPPYCPLPSDLTYKINTDHSIEVNWTEPVDLNTFTEYNWKLMNTGDDPLIDNAVQTGNANQGMDFIILNGVPGGTYDFYISTNCGTDLSNMAQITLEISYLGLTQEVMETIIYPNPASNQIQIKSQLSLTLVEIFNSTGKLVLQNVFTWDEEQLDISSLQEGQYTIRLSNNNYTVTKKLIITK